MTTDNTTKSVVYQFGYVGPNQVDTQQNPFLEKKEKKKNKETHTHTLILFYATLSTAPYCLHLLMLCVCVCFFPSLLFECACESIFCVCL